MSLIDCMQIKPNGTRIFHELRSENLLEQVQNITGWSFCEIVHTICKLRNPRYELVFVIDDCGKLKENWQKDINYCISWLYTGYPNDVLVGDVFAFGLEWNKNFSEYDLISFSEVLKFL